MSTRFAWETCGLSPVFQIFEAEVQAALKMKATLERVVLNKT